MHKKKHHCVFKLKQYFREAYLELFVRECEELLRQGLVKKYRAVSKNCSALKGKLLFDKHIEDQPDTQGTILYPPSSI